MKECWRRIAGLPGYMVSTLGRVKSLSQKVGGPYGSTRSIPGQILKTPVRGAGYPCVCIRKKNLLVHRLIAFAFLGAPAAPDDEVNHKNGIKAESVLSNLEWLTASENQKHSYKELGRRPTSKGKFSGAHPTSIPVISTCLKTGRERRYRAAMDAVRAGFRSDGISRACAGKIAHHKGHIWRYADGYQGRVWA